MYIYKILGKIYLKKYKLMQKKGNLMSADIVDINQHRKFNSNSNAKRINSMLKTMDGFMQIKESDYQEFIQECLQAFEHAGFKVMFIGQEMNDNRDNQ